MIKVNALNELERFHHEAAFYVLDTIPIIRESLISAAKIRQQTTFCMLQANPAFYDEWNEHLFNSQIQDDEEVWIKWAAELGSLLYGFPLVPEVRNISRELLIFAAYKTRVVPVVMDGPDEDRGLIHVITDPDKWPLFERPALRILRKSEPVERTAGTRTTYEFSPNAALSKLITEAQREYIETLKSEKIEEIEKELKKALGVRSARVHEMEKTDKGTYTIKFFWPNWKC